MFTLIFTISMILHILTKILLFLSFHLYLFQIIDISILLLIFNLMRPTNLHKDPLIFHRIALLILSFDYQYQRLHNNFKESLILTTKTYHLQENQNNQF